MPSKSAKRIQELLEENRALTLECDRLCNELIQARKSRNYWKSKVYYFMYGEPK